MRKGQRSVKRRVTNPTSVVSEKPPRDAAGDVKVLFFSDIHFPYQDPKAVERVLDHIESEEFDYIIHGGDGIDAYSVSKYNPDPARLLQLQAELDEQARFLARVNALQPDARKMYLLGNHELRIPTYVRREAPALESLRGLGMDSLLETSANGFELIGQEGVLINDTRYKHGEKVAKGGGNSVIKEMEHHWRNVVMGHCHRRATRRIRKDDREFVGAESGGLMDLAPNYVNFPDWQPGWLVCTHHGGAMDVREYTP